MSAGSLAEIAQSMVADHKGLLAIDESNGTCNQRFRAAGIPQNKESRCDYRELILTTPGLGECISGVILYDETIHQQTADGTPFVELIARADMLIGIKVDIGTRPLAACPDELITEGLDGLGQRLQEYAAMGACFAKWRAVISIDQGGKSTPSQACISVNAHTLARYAALCQEAGLVPIVEPEVLMSGNHSLARCCEVTEAVLQEVFEQLHRQRVSLEAIILKPNMVLPGQACKVQNPLDEVANATVQTLLRVVPAAVPGVAFLSGGQTGYLAADRLNAMHVQFPSLPWALTFSFGRAIQQPALRIWGGKLSNREAAQKALLQRARCNQAALQGNYVVAMEAA